jgi:2-(1,2-epoxy-1,2-dihydrophenyl)acetyl-CoA isomerase
MNPAPPAVLYEPGNGVGRIVFNRPRHLNALNLEAAQLFSKAVAAAADDPALRVLVLVGAGRAFIAGGDLTAFHEALDKPSAARALVETVHQAIEGLAVAPFIVVASLHGPVAGAGLSIALAADLAIASDDATFNLAYAQIGTSPDCGATWTLPRLVGPRRALEIALLSDTITARQALDLGLINRIVPAGDLGTETANLATRIATGPAVAHTWIKRLIRQSYASTFPKQLADECDGFVACAATRDFSAALDAFFAKKRPAFEGR